MTPGCVHHPLQAWYHGANPGIDVTIELGGSGGIGAFLSTVLVGAVLLALAPGFGALLEDWL